MSAPERNINEIEREARKVRSARDFGKDFGNLKLQLLTATTIEQATALEELYQSLKQDFDQRVMGELLNSGAQADTETADQFDKFDFGKAIAALRQRIVDAKKEQPPSLEEQERLLRERAKNLGIGKRTIAQANFRELQRLVNQKLNNRTEAEAVSPVSSNTVVDIELARKQSKTTKEEKGAAENAPEKPGVAVAGSRRNVGAGGGEGGEPPEEGEQKKLSKAEKKGSKKKTKKRKPGEIEKLVGYEPPPPMKVTSPKLVTGIKEAEHLQPEAEKVEPPAAAEPQAVAPEPGAEKVGEQGSPAAAGPASSEVPPQPAPAAAAVRPVMTEATTQGGEQPTGPTVLQSKPAPESLVPQREVPSRPKPQPKGRELRRITVETSKGTGKIEKAINGVKGQRTSEAKPRVEKRNQNEDFYRQVEKRLARGKLSDQEKTNLFNQLWGMHARDTQEQRRKLELARRVDPERHARYSRNGKKEATPRIASQTERDFAQMVTDFVGDFQKLSASTEKEGEEKFRQAARGALVFAFGGKALEKREKLGEDIWYKQDFDVRIARWFLHRAGIPDALLRADRLIPQGTSEPGSIMVDTGGREGVSRDVNLTKNVKVGPGEYARPSWFIDNHYRSRVVGGSHSSAERWFEMLTESGMFPEKLPRADKEAMKMMARFTIDEDNATLPFSNPDNRKADFEKGYKTLRGLAHYMDVEDIFRYFRNIYEAGSAKGKTEDEIYLRTITGHEFSDGELREFGLKKPLPEYGGRTAQELARQTINQAKERLDKPREQLLEQGEIIETRFGDFAVDFVDNWEKDKLKAGYLGAQAYGLRGIISFDNKTDSFSISILDRPGKEKIDLSSDAAITELEKLSGGIIVRGVMLVRKADVSGRRVSFRKILEIVGMKGEPRGKVKEALAIPEPLLPKDDAEAKAMLNILKKHFKAIAGEIGLQDFTALDLDGRLKDKNGTPTHRRIDSAVWENLKVLVFHELAKRKAQKEARERVKNETQQEPEPVITEATALERKPQTGPPAPEAKRDRFAFEDDPLYQEILKSGTPPKEAQKQFLREELGQDSIYAEPTGTSPEKMEQEQQRENVTRDWEEKIRDWLVGEGKTEEQIQQYFGIFRESEVDKIMKMIEEENA